MTAEYTKISAVDTLDDGKDETPGIRLTEKSLGKTAPVIYGVYRCPKDGNLTIIGHPTRQSANIYEPNCRDDSHSKRQKMNKLFELKPEEYESFKEDHKPRSS